MGLMWLKKIALKVEANQKGLFDYPIDQQKTYIAHFPEPKDELERSYFQYCCQMQFYQKWLHCVLSLAALPMSVLYLLKYTHTHVEKAEGENDCVFIRYDLPENIMPDSLRQRYPGMLNIKTPENSLDREDIAFLKTIFKRYPFSWMFWLKLIIKISQYSNTIQKFAPGAIVSCDEYSFTSSAVTAYCRSKGIKRINIMHGEKMYYLRDSFMEYDEYYVWDQHYVDLLTDMGAKKEQFRVEIPQSMRLKKLDNISIQYDYTCYLQREKEDALQLLANALRALHQKGMRISVRPHPRYSDIALVTNLFDFANIEDRNAVTIEQSLLQTGAVISLYSTVLNQAVGNSIPIVIDDISNRSRFEKLKELRYICLHKDHKLLSEIIGEIQ